MTQLEQPRKRAARPGGYRKHRRRKGELIPSNSLKLRSNKVARLP